MDIWCRKPPLYQLRHNHYVAEGFLLISHLLVSVYFLTQGSALVHSVTATPLPIVEGFFVLATILFIAGMEFFLNRNQFPECRDPVSAQNTITKFHHTVFCSDIKHWRHACPVPCKQQSYIVEVKRFQQNHHAGYDDTYSQDFLANGAILELLYDSYTIREEVETLVYDSGNFWVSVGGNLGLFLGFSCLSVLLGIFNYFAEFSFKNNQCVTGLSELKDVFRRRVK